jgi:hypothetical protein
LVLEGEEIFAVESAFECLLLIDGPESEAGSILV